MEGGLFVFLILAVFCFLHYKYFVFNKKLPFSKIESYLDSENLVHVRHQKIKKPWNPNFENDETIFFILVYRKHHYLIDAIDHKGNPTEVEGTYYQPLSFFHKNKVIFKTKR